MTTHIEQIDKFSKPETELRHEHMAAQQTRHMTKDLFSPQHSAGNLAVQRMLRNSAIQAKLVVGHRHDPLEDEADRVAEQMIHTNAESCHCGGSCVDCQGRKEGIIQRKLTPHLSQATNADFTVSESFRDQLGGGTPLDFVTRSFFESRFGHDFSQVRVHTDAKAAESAEAVNALAYTIGHNVVFGTGQYEPTPSQGRRLLAHELTHVVQQTTTSGHGVSGSNADTETEAQQSAERILTGTTVPITVPSARGIIQRQPSLSSEERKLDEFALGLINLAQDEKIDFRFPAFEIVWKIIGHFYPTEASLVSGVGYKKGLSGLQTEVPDKLGPNVTTSIIVGDDFVKGVNKKEFARRVLQVGHELEHIQQFRTGMADKDEREFLAFYHEALTVEKPHTGHVQHSTRIRLINTALGYFNCLQEKMKDQLPEDYVDKQKELLTRRQAEITDMKSIGYITEPEPAPTTCKRQ